MYYIRIIFEYNMTRICQRYNKGMTRNRLKTDATRRAKQIAPPRAQEKKDAGI